MQRLVLYDCLRSTQRADCTTTSARSSIRPITSRRSPVESQVQRDASLGYVQVQVGGAGLDVIGIRRKGAKASNGAAGYRLDGNDIGAEGREESTAVCASDGLAELEDPQSGEGRRAFNYIA